MISSHRDECKEFNPSVGYTRAIILVFDPGALRCLHDDVLRVTCWFVLRVTCWFFLRVGNPKIQQLLQDILKGKELHTEGKENTMM